LTSSSAYEISTFHKREPPPKEILEDVSAKGGDLLNRTLENYLPRASREADNLANGDRSDSEDEHNTPKANDKMDIDEPGSTGGRATRGTCYVWRVMMEVRLRLRRVMDCVTIPARSLLTACGNISYVIRKSVGHLPSTRRYRTVQAVAEKMLMSLVQM
jgi:hypothetical protein